MSEGNRLERGREIRSAVLGASYVEQSMARATPFAQPLQELVTEYCWGTIWARPGLDRRTRSLLNLGMLAALNHQSEVTLHTTGAIRNGCTPEEIQEVLLQVAVYCGVPAALNAMRSAQAGMAAAAEAAAGEAAAARSD
jgi:4-carboxymuconolactone decarboxylase